MIALFGRLTWWLAWPFWLVYFKVNPVRSRVLVVHGGKLLLVKGIIGDGKWGLPGGGARPGEPVADSAVRELEEEAGLKAAADQLEQLGDFVHSQAGVRYQAYFFLHRPDTVGRLKRRKGEIAAIGWFDRQALATLSLNADARKALEQYGSRIWYTGQ